MPLSLHHWQRAANDAGEGYYLNNYKPAGYALPDSNIIAGTSNVMTRAVFFMAVLKLQLVLIYQLSSSKFKTLSVNQW
ncbi:hypothetical protein Moror_15724 [Moniliophthora roreri MCA 2997]|uniref:Uncharacterized protein n=1 Tax=Moniliophthora roreri (strain MCA 2997) TaxID=1381753 RepID=V2WXR9_MONRO|nr:hypothetical protein Moror_15724 [Moniliophthora roreri MCA 2997]